MHSLHRRKLHENTGLRIFFAGWVAQNLHALFVKYLLFLCSGTQIYCSQSSSIFPMVQQPLEGQGPSHYPGFMITLRHTTFGRIHLDG